jgi:RNA polymerase primary sigma factor
MCASMKGIGLSRTSPEPRAAVGLYLAEIRNIRLLSKDREEQLSVRAAAGDRDALSSLVEHHLPLVVGLARGYAGRGVSLEDLIQEGNLGLLRAAERFDPTRGVRFATYATWWVRQHISRAALRLAQDIRVPRTILVDRRRVDAIAEGLARQMGRQPTDSELAAATGRPAARIRFLRSIPDEPVSLDGPGAGGSALAAIAVAFPDATSEEAAAVDEIVQELPPRLQEVVRLRFGLQGDRPLTLREVGRRLHISRERVRQLVGRAIRRIRLHQVA